MTTAAELQKLFHSCMPIFIALGDKVRLSIIEVLTENAMALDPTGVSVDFADRAMNVNEITRRTSLSRPAISHHLKILKAAGLVDVREDGTANYYYLTLREPTRQLMELGFLMEEFIF